jgi:hypothetical protein
MPLMSLSQSDIMLKGCELEPYSPSIFIADAGKFFID